MTICMEVDRGGIGEKNIVLHNDWDEMPTREEVEAYLEGEDIGYDYKYCGLKFYRVS